MVDIIIQIGITQTKMINYKYLEYWRKDMEQIRLIEILMKLIRLKQITKECYDIAFQLT